MGRTPLNTPQDVRNAVQRLLDGAGVSAPITPALFRKLVSTRRVRDVLGAGDAGWIGRQIREIQTQITAESDRRHTVPGLPCAIADSMRALWVEALEAAHGELAAARADAAETVARAEAERNNAAALTAMLQTELQDWKKQVREQDVLIGKQREELTQIRHQLGAETDRARRAEASLDQAARTLDEATRQHDEKLAAVTNQYAGLSNRLLTTTDDHRQAQAAEVNELRRRLAQVSEQYQKLLAAGAETSTNARSASPPTDQPNPAGR